MRLEKDLRTNGHVAKIIGHQERSGEECPAKLDKRKETKTANKAIWVCSCTRVKGWLPTMI
jgi:hypothetical protein